MAVPVGDYLPADLRITFGRLSISISHNFHSDGHPRDRQGRPHVYGIRIRKDRPFVLDFSTKPEVLFASPAKNLHVKRGETVLVKAVLIDPVLDIMIRELRGPSRKRSRVAKDPQGKEQRSAEVLSLDPAVSITDASGKVVATGTMPFG